MSRFGIEWRGAERWVVLDHEDDRAEVARFDALHEAEQYVIERSTRSER